MTIPVRITSFGYLHGSPPSAQLTVDVRDLFRDPHVDPAMRQMTGRDQAVIANVLKQPGAERFARDIAHTASGLSIVRDDVTIAIGCAGGRHRSVVLAAYIANWLRRVGYRPATVEHRDIDKPVVERVTEQCSLTDRELVLLHGFAEGATNREIGRTIDRSEDSVRQYASALYRKLGAVDRAHAVILAVRAGALS